ncbi:MAG TPA: hypothetical protein DD405_03900 [Desulfobacteraceae bacterium]|nr:hypothetical protein [Desulfobacteraceae bacterium]
MNKLKHIWSLLGNTNLMFGLIVLMILDLTVGYFMLKSHPHLFYPINDMGFLKWSATYGKNNLYETAWLYLLIFFLAILFVNTFICTTQRVTILFRNQSFLGYKFRFIIKLSPHIMHYALLIMLLGYLVSYLSSETCLNNVLLPKQSIRIPNSLCEIYLNRLHIDYYQGERLQYMQDRAIDVQADLTIQNKKKIVTGRLGFNKPVWFLPYSIHLKDFAPKSKAGMNRRAYINVIIKKDPGTKYYFSGMVLFTFGLLLYSVNWLVERNRP